MSYPRSQGWQRQHRDWSPGLEDSESSAQVPHGPLPLRNTQLGLLGLSLPSKLVLSPDFCLKVPGSVFSVGRPSPRAGAGSHIVHTSHLGDPERVPQAMHPGPDRGETGMKQPPDLLRSVPGTVLKGRTVTSDLYR